ncbi:MAG: hypothetical protein V7642_534 [Burkholderiales bacterium]|jgi:hypothetical protein
MRTVGRYAVLASLILSSVAGYPAFAATQTLGADEAKAVMDICSANTAAERTRPLVSEAKSVYFVNLRDGDKVTSPFRIAFGLVGMGVAPAGVKVANTGHHHLLIDEKLSNEMMLTAIPFTDKYRHFGKGETEATLELPVGKHTLRLLFADADHKPYFVSSKEITIEVIAKNALSK